MPSNVEIKARLHDIALTTSLARIISDSDGSILDQMDTFFLAPNGRLKLRQIVGQAAQLIFYVRNDLSGPKLSEYHISTVNNPEELRLTLAMALGIKGTVKKRRTLYLVGQTRIHIDSVEGLGDFLELEVVLRPDQTTEQGIEIANQIMAQLNITEADLVTGAYMDLLSSGDCRPDVVSSLPA